MADNTQNSGGQQQHGGKANQGREQNEQQKGKDQTTNIWHKIQQGAAAKEKIGDLKQGLNAQPGQPEGGHKKKRRRRRRKKRSFGAGQQEQVVGQTQVNNQSKQADQQPKQIEQPVAHFEDEDQETFEEITPFTDEEEAETEPAVESPPVEPVEPEPVVEEVPPAPPVAPINPFDFNPEPLYQAEPVVEPALPSSTYFKHDVEAKKAEEVKPIDQINPAKPINPFDLPDPARNVPMAPAEEIADEKEESPEETGESDEFQAINTGDSVETANRDDDLKVEKKNDVIEVKAEEIKERKIEPVFPENLASDEVPPKEDLWIVLEHAGITKRKLLIFAVVILVALGVGLFFIFGGMKLFSSSGEVKDSPIKRDAVKAQPEKTVETKPIVTPSDQRPYDIISSYIFGLEFKSPEVIKAEPITSFGDIGGVDSGLIFGKIINLKEEQFVEYVKVLEQMNNIYNVDIYSMLNLAVDRRAALNKYLTDMDSLINSATTALANIQAHLTQMNEQYDIISKKAAAYETTFFSYARNYYGQTAYDNLKLFMDTSNEAARIKAQYGAENALKTMFINSLNALKPRYKDVSSNTEALIQGVKVFDIKNSNINAIIPVQ